METNETTPAPSATPNNKRNDNNFGCIISTIVVIVIAVAFMLRACEGTTTQVNTDGYITTELENDLDYLEASASNTASGDKIVDRWSKRAILENLSWISYEEGDSLLAYAQKNRRGYLNLRQRKATLLDKKIVKAYLYSEGRALAESLDSLYILDTRQQVVASYAKSKERDTEVNSFHKGHMPMVGDNGKLGLIDTCGTWAIEPQYDKVSWALDEFWLGITHPVMVDEKTGKQTDPHRIMMDSKLRTVMEGDWNYLMVTKEGYVTVADKNHWQWHYALDGTEIDNFVCQDVVQMTYTTGEKRWITEGTGEGTCIQRQVDVEETATLLKYVTSENWEGLMTKEGKIVTPPIFWQITAVSKNLYLCKYDTTSEHGILLNERGERINVKF